ncbi:MAG: hypothetical protein AAF384_00790, partial [Pseudomonadota bacterium]
QQKLLALQETPIENRPSEAEDDAQCRIARFPVTLADVPKFENMNDVAVNVFGYEDKVVFPRLLSRYSHWKTQIDQLMLQDGERWHYVWIKSLSRLVSKQYNKHGHMLHICRYCLHCFQTEEILHSHIERCSHHGAQRVYLPEDNDIKGRDHMYE